MEIVPLRLPRALFCDNQRLPAGYCNFLIANGVVIVPQFGDPADEAAIRTYLADLAFLYKWKAQPQGMPRRVKVTMSKDTASGTLASPQFMNQQRKLSRVNNVRQPVLRANGRIELLPEGYDPESGVYTMPGAVVIREDMSIDEAREILLDLHREFPFCDWSHLPPDERRESREDDQHDQDEEQLCAQWNPPCDTDAAQRGRLAASPGLGGASAAR